MSTVANNIIKAVEKEFGGGFGIRHKLKQEIRAECDRLEAALHATEILECQEAMEATQLRADNAKLEQELKDAREGLPKVIKAPCKCEKCGQVVESPTTGCTLDTCFKCGGKMKEIHPNALEELKQDAIRIENGTEVARLRESMKWNHVQDQLDRAERAHLEDKLTAAESRIAALEAESGSFHGKIGLLAERLFGINNNLPTDETLAKLETCVQGTKLRLERMEVTHSAFDADMVDFMQKVQSGEVTCIRAAQVIEAKVAALERDGELLTGGVRLIAAQRERQKTCEGWSLGHDDEHDEGELAKAAACYALDSTFSWPWDFQYWKPGGGRIRQLTKAGALIAAEIERLQRIDAAQQADATTGKTEGGK